MSSVDNDEECKKLEYLESVTSKLLYSNNKKKRNRGFSSVQLFLSTTETGVSAEEYDRLWVMLFRCFWKCDKETMQEKIAKKISKLLYFIPTYNSKLMFIRAAFLSLSGKWDEVFGQYENKFLIFVRRLMKQCLIMLKKYKWHQETVEAFSKEIYQIIQILPFGLIKMLSQIVVKELAKITKGKISTMTLIGILNGFFICIMDLKPSMDVAMDIKNTIFIPLAEQLKLFIRKSLIEQYDRKNNDRRNHKEEEEKDDTEDGRQLKSKVRENDQTVPFIEFDEQMFVNLFRHYRDKESIDKSAKYIANILIMEYNSITGMRICIRKAEKAAENPEKRKVEEPNSVMRARIKKQYVVRDVKTWERSKDTPQNNEDENTENGTNQNESESVVEEDRTNGDVDEGETNVTIQGSNDILDNVQARDENTNTEIPSDEGIEILNEESLDGMDEMEEDEDDEAFEPEHFDRRVSNDENESLEDGGGNAASCSARMKRSIDTEDDSKKSNVRKKSKMVKVTNDFPPRRESLRSFTAMMKELEKKRMNMPIVLNRDHPEWKIVPKEKIVKFMSMIDDVTCGDPNRKVKFYLGRNSYQDVEEHNMSLEQNPEIPYSPTRKPSKGLLKRMPDEGPPAMKLMEIEINLPDEDAVVTDISSTTASTSVCDRDV